MGWPNLHFQSILSQGDIGRDLYTFEQVWKGKLVYKDIWWVYGPLMPYYYGLFYLIFGFKITSILLGKLLVNICAAVFFYLAGSTVMAPFWAFLSACFFLQFQQDFFFTYNHIGGVALTIAVFWLILKYLHEGKIQSILQAVLCCFIIGLIKINFGMSALAGVVISVSLIDFTNPLKKKIVTSANKPFYWLAFIVVPVLWIAVYGTLLGGMPIYEIRQCMPYFGTDEPYHQTLIQTIPYFLMQHYLTFYHHWLNLKSVFASLSAAPSHFFTPIGSLMTVIVVLTFLMHPIMHGSTIATLIISFKNKFNAQRKKFWLTQAILWLFFILDFHEFFFSGRWYRTFWSQPFLLFFNFFMIATAMSFAPKWLRRTVAGLWISYFLVLNFVSFVSTKASSTSDKFLSMPRGQVYVGNETPWVDTVNTVTSYLNQTLKSHELFFALPYDCLYYYLTGKPSPTRQIIFFDHIKIPPQQEISIIQELEKNKVNYILMSNRVTASETGLGIFGKTYCPVIYRYLIENFAPVFRYGGNWNAEPGTHDNHGVIIFKRKNPL